MVSRMLYCRNDDQQALIRWHQRQYPTHQNNQNNRRSLTIRYGGHESIEEVNTKSIALRDEITNTQNQSLRSSRNDRFDIEDDSL